MIKTTYQTPEIRDANDNIVQQGSFGKTTPLTNSTNNGWTDYVVNDLEALHDGLTTTQSAVTAKTSTDNADRGVWFADTSNAAGFVRNADFYYNPSKTMLNLSSIKATSGVYYPMVNGGGYTNAGSSVTGRIIIKPPVTISETNLNRYLYFTVIIDEFSASMHRTMIRIGCCFNQQTAVWTGCSAYMLNNDDNITEINFGNDGTNPYIAIGKATNKWTYLKLAISDFQSGGTVAEGSWSFTISNADLPNVAKTIYYPSASEPIDSSSGVHNVPFRSRTLGTTLTDDQLARIKDATFRGLNVGDKWVDSNNITWHIAAVNYFYNIGNPRFTTNHIVVVPNKMWYFTKMNSTATTEGGYVGSEMFEELEENVLPTIEGVFGADNILPHSVYLPTTCVGGDYTAGAYYTRKVDIMNETMVLGSQRRSDVPWTYGTQATILPLFLFYRSLLRCTNSSGNARGWWLYNVATSSSFMGINTYGLPTTFTATSTTVGVRPFFIVG